MREEIGAAVLFITRLIRQSGSLSSEKVVEFSNSLSAILNEKFQNHWYQDHPTKGQGYRCIRINSSEPIDPVLEKAARNSGLQYHDLRLPSELTLWVDPKDVCCRFGESRGSFCTLVTSKDGNLETRAHTVNIEELLRQEMERHNQQVNIVTTRSNINSSHTKFSKSVHNSNYYGWICFFRLCEHETSYQMDFTLKYMYMWMVESCQWHSTTSYRLSNAEYLIQ